MSETTTHLCLVCQSEIIEFLPYGEPEKIGKCPVCGAKPRNRAMGYFFKEWCSPHWNQDTQVLEIGASKLHTRRLIDPHFLGSAQYTVVDVRKLKHHDQLSENYNFRQMDAGNMDWEDESFDHIFCNYVLQDAPEPFEIIKEISRCLKPEGWGTLNVAFLADKTRSVESIPKEEIVTENTEAYYDINGRTYQFGPDFHDILNDYGLSSMMVKPFENFSEAWTTRNQVKPHQEFILIAKSKETLEKLTKKFSEHRV